MTTLIEVDPHDPKTVRVGGVYWRLWRSDAGHPYATRAGNLTNQQFAVGCVMTIPADNQEDLERKLLAQPAVDELGVET